MSDQFFVIVVTISVSLFICFWCFIWYFNSHLSGVLLLPAMYTYIHTYMTMTMNEYVFLKSIVYGVVLLYQPTNQSRLTLLLNTFVRWNIQKKKKLKKTEYFFNKFTGIVQNLWAQLFSICKDLNKN